MTTPETIQDELTIITRHVPVAGEQIVDIGCGNGAMTLRLVTEAGAAGVLGLDIEAALPPDAGQVAGVAFRAGRAEALDLDDGSVAGALMLKSLHHVPVGRMAAALVEVARVLKPGGVLYVSEPMARGPFDEIMRHFHDEAEVRAAAQAALKATRALQIVDDFSFLSPIAFSDFADFERRMMTLPTLTRPITAQMREATEAAYRAHAAPDGRFAVDREFQVTVLRAPAAARATAA